MILKVMKSGHLEDDLICDKKCDILKVRIDTNLIYELYL